MPLSVESALRKDRLNGQAPPTANLQHRHFAFIAAAVAALDGEKDRQQMAEHFAAWCAQSNPRFDRARFMRACNVAL